MNHIILGAKNKILSNLNDWYNNDLNKSKKYKPKNNSV